MQDEKKKKGLPVLRKPAVYEELQRLDDGRINVMLLGTSGCGKSTLINGILGTEEAGTGVGEAVTRRISVYQSDELPFRMIDTVGYEYNIFRQNRIKNELIRYSRDSVRKSDVEKLVHMIWFCIDGTSKRIDQTVLGYIRSISNDWKNVPIIVVFTKSYSSTEIDENIRMAREAIEKYNSAHKKAPLNIMDIIPVVAKTYAINDSVSIPASGLDVLVTRTVELIPEAKRLADRSVVELDLKLKRNMATGFVAASSAAAAVVGAVPIPVADSAVLLPLQVSMLNTLAKTYGLKERSVVNGLIDSIMKVGATTIAGKTIFSMLKAVPGLNAVGSVLNAAVAGVITFVTGEVSMVMFEKEYTGELDTFSHDYEKEIALLFNSYLPDIVGKLKVFSENSGGKITPAGIAEFLRSLVTRDKQ